MTINKIKRPIGDEKINEHIKARIKEVEEQEKKKVEVKVIKGRKKGIVEMELIRQGYWPEEDTHHDNIRAAFVIASLLVGIYIASILMLIKMYLTFDYFFEVPLNPIYYPTFIYGDLIHYYIAKYLLFLPFSICLLYKLIWIHIPRMREVQWHKMIPRKEQTKFTKTLNKYMDYYMFIGTLVLNAYGESMAIYLTTFDLDDIIYVHNNESNQLFFWWEVYLLKAVGLWVEWDITFEAKYACCVKFIIYEQLYIPEPIKNRYNLRTGMDLDSWLYLETQQHSNPEDIFFGKCTPDKPGHIPLLFKILRTKGPEAAREELLNLYKEEVKGYNETMIETQKGVCEAYGEYKPQTQVKNIHFLHTPYPKRWLKEMAKGER